MGNCQNCALYRNQRLVFEMYIDEATLLSALRSLYGTAGHLLKIWFTLKQMGFGVNQSVEIDTANSTSSLQRLFSYGDPDGQLYVPFAHTPRYLTMKGDASRSIIQTNIQRWATSGSVVTCDPTAYIDFVTTPSGKLQISPGRSYPLGLGYGESGFALANNVRVTIPLHAFAVWYGRKTEIPPNAEPVNFLTEKMLLGLNISSPEKDVIFVSDSLPIALQPEPLDDSDIYRICQRFVTGNEQNRTSAKIEDFTTYERRVKRMIPNLDMPQWMRVDPENEVRSLVESGVLSILIYGPPRTGKTRMIDSIVPRSDSSRETIQIHDGWSYDNLIEGFRPDQSGQWDWCDGPLKTAIEKGKKFVVLEEINRTTLSQALGEVFSLLEAQYRGPENAIRLRSGKDFHIPTDTVFLMTMNTIDKSTEEIDDALLGRVSAVEFPSSPQMLKSMLEQNEVPEPIREKILELYGKIIQVYELGHGYFAEIRSNADEDQVKRHYRTRVRPVISNHFGILRRAEISEIDTFLDTLFRQ